jgi:2-oxoisovalerate dehydrogenase E1 component
MPKDLLVDPAIVRGRGRLDLAPIPINSYRPDLAAERREYGDERLVAVARDMMLIREFESMLDAIKREGEYRGVAYRHAGPAHLSIGQEAAAVGQALTLDARDLVFGSHRSHGEVLAKGLRAIAVLPEHEVAGAAERWLDGLTYARVAEHLPGGDAETRAIRFLLYGLTAEIFGRSTGFNRGLGGSMHAFFPPFGIFPNNAIVGGSAPLAAGAGLFKRVRREPGLVVASIGDAATGCGPVWEAMNFAAMSQLRTLFDEDHRGGLPVVFFIVNNFYGMGGQTIGETMGYERVARVGAGIDPENMHAETVDGNDPLAVADAMRRARAHIEAGTGPVLIDCQTYRQSGHSPSDASSYRTREEIELWRSVDPVVSFTERLVEGGVLDGGRRDRLREWARERVTEVLRLAVDDAVSPRLDLRREPERMARYTFRDTAAALEGAPAGRTLVPLAEVSRVKTLAGRSRSGVAGGRVLPASRAVTFRDALFEAVAHHVVADDRLTLWGEENRDWDGAFGVYRGLTELLPRHRLFNAPISEAAIVGGAAGFALAGGRALVELMYADFIGRAGDEIFNQLAKWQAMSGGTVGMPVVVRVSVGSKYGAQHSQDWSSMVASVPGLKVAFPATPYDAKGMLAAALAGDDPVVFFESQRLYDTTETLREGGVPAGHYTVPLGVPNVVRRGDDLTILSVGAALYRALEAADTLRDRYGVAAGVIDARSLVPFDAGPVIEAVRRSGRLVCVSDACHRGSWLHTVAGQVAEAANDAPDAPVTVLRARDCITPPAELEWDYFPTAADIVDAVHTRMLPLPGHRVP